MKGRAEIFFYVTVAVGMALATSSFTVLSGMFQIGPGAPILAAILAAGALCYLLSWSVAELASMFPSAPGIRTYFNAAFGPSTSLAIVYLYLIFTVFMAGVEANLFALVLDGLTTGIPGYWTVVLLLLTITVINLVGLELPRSAQMFITVVGVAVLLLLAVVGLARAPVGSIARLFPEAGGAAGWEILPSAIGMAVFLYMGFEWATPVGLRPKSYERSIPIALPLSIGLLAVVYLLFASAATLQLPREVLGASSVPHLPVARAVFGVWGSLLALVLACGASLSTFNAGIMGGSRLVFMLAREGHLPAWCGRASPRSGAPQGAVLLLGISATATALLVMKLQVQLLLAVVGATIMCCVYGCFALAVIALRRRRPGMRRPYRTPAPAYAQWLLVTVLPLVGLSALFSLPSLGLRPALSAAAAVAAAVFLARWSTVRSVSRPLRRPMVE